MMVVPVLLVILRLLLAAVFTASAFTKLADRSSFKSALGGFAVPEGLRGLAAALIPVFELAIGIGLLSAASVWVAAVGALGLLVLFTVAIIASLVRGTPPECHCFGQLSSAPVTWKTVMRNGILMAAAAAIAVHGSANPGPSMVAWATRLTPPEVFGLAAAAVIVGVMVTETWMLARVLRQNGRLLLRLDVVEASLAGAGPRAAPGAHAATSARDGVPQGVPAPAFHLNRLNGGTSTMTELLAPGKPLALAFVDPDCEPCSALLPELARWERQLADQVTLAVITTGSADANNRKLAGHDLHHVLLQDGREVSEAYRAYGTPSMVLVESSGMVSGPAAPGRDAIRGLMARFTAVQHQPDDTGRQKALNLALNGSKGAHGGVGATRHPHVGEAAPDLRLPDIDGRQVSLAAFRGHATLVLFWNPACGFCLRMLDDLRAWEASRAAASPRLLVVSMGSAETNRAMGLRSPVVLDAGFESARAFGASGTPSAVLIDNDGRVASEVAVGGQAVMALATEPVTMLEMDV
jgi:peroxiredoxin/uncharacterized membrane protein YphA (DoxX/SURF4 family)